MMQRLYGLGRTALALGLGLPGGSALASNYYFTTEGAGPYCRFDIGPTFFQNGQLTGFGGPANSTIQYDVGFIADTAFGYAFNKYLATDFEFGFIGAQIDSVSGFYTYSSYVDNLPFLGNITLSYPIPRTLLVPYIGGGLGGSLTTFSTDGFGDNNVTVFGSESDVVFAWQGFAGVRVNLSRQMSLGLGYKYFATMDPSISYPPGYPYSGPNFPMSFKGVSTHSILVTFQFKF
jgi:opacity protein-like surface antigen